MKAKRRIAWLLSFLMVFSLIMGTSKMQVFSAGGAGETATFEIRESNGQTGTVQYKLNGSGDFTTANNNTSVNLEGVTSITIKAIPTGEAQVNQNNSGITGTERTENFDYGALISESGWTYNIQDNDGNITFTIGFDNYDGTGGGGNPGENAAPYSVDFGTGSWKVGDVTVTADKSGEQTLYEGDIITLTGFDAETMEARVDAEDGFWTTLTVTDGQTSISAHTNDGGVPTDIAFSVVEKSTGGGGGDNPQQSGPSIGFFADSSIEGGTLAVNNGIFTFSKDGNGLGTFRVTLVDSAGQETAYAGNEEIIPLNDISSVKIVMTPAEGMKAQLITGGDTPVGALSERVFNDAGNTYTYTAYPSQFGGEQQFLGVSVWFGESEDDFNQVDFTAVIWDGDQVENKSGHGSITVSSVVIGSTTYTYKGNGRFENNNTETDLIEWYGYNKTSINEEAGVRIMDAAFADPNTEVYINFVFKPDYGYQVTGIGTNESTTSLASAGFSASETISTFRFKVIQHNNPHFAVAFSESPDIINVSGAQDVNAAKISNGQNATDSGNLKLTVADHSGTYAKESEALNLARGENANATTIATLDMTLDSMVSKGNGQYWTDNITSFTYDINVNLELNDTTYEPGDTYVVVREHDGQLDKLTTTYSNGMLEVPTNKFSTYSIVKIPVAAEDRPNMYLEYDPRGEGDEAGTVTVKCNGAELTGTDGYYKYSNPAQEITFELKRPADRTDTGKYTPVVDVVFPQEGEEPVIKHPTVTDNKFTVTPSTDSGLTGSPFMEVYVHWSEYDSVGPDEDQFMVILRKYSDADSFVFQNNPTVQRTASLDDETKYIFANGTNVSVEIQPGENRELVEVYVDTSGQLTHYSAEPQEGDRDIAELKTSDGKFVVSNLAPWTMVEAICIDLPVLSNIQLTNTSQTLYDTMKRSEVGISATCTLGGMPLTGTVELDGGNELLTVGENEYKVIFTSDPINEQGERIYAEGAITLKVLHQVDISGLGWTGTTFTYNGTAQGPTFNCNLQNVRVSSTRGNSEVNVAEYTAVASVTLAEGLSTEYYKLVNPSGTTGITITENGAIATVTQSWSITAKDLASAEITLGDALTYNGATQTQTIASVKVDGRTLTAGTDYEVSGNTGTNAETYTLTITGQGNYTGTATKDWSIGKKSITGATITLGATLTYDGTTQTQTISSVVIGDKTLTASDYTISGNEQKDAGTYTLTVEGTGNYTGTATKQFTIEKATLTPALSGTTAKVYDNTTAVTATNDLTLSVTGLKNSETVTVTAAAYAYDNANAGTGKTITATGITISGDAAKNYVLSVDTATLANGEITQATPTITLSNLSETTQAPTGAKATLTPADASAAVVVEYKVVDTPAVAATPGVPCNVTHEDTCASKQEGNTIEDCNCRVKTHIHDEECGYKAATSGTPATYKWVTTRPTTPGTYEVRAYLPTGTTNVAAIAVENAVTGSYTLTQYTAPTGDNTNNNTGSSSSSGSTTTTPTTPATTTPETPAATDTTTTKPAIKKPVAQTEETVAGTTTGVTSEDGSSGWTDIENEISDKLEAALEAAGEDGETETVEVVVEMNGEKKIPTDIFEAIKGQNIEVTFEMGDGIAWTVNGMDVTADKFDNISFGASTGSGVTAIPTELIAGIAGEKFGMELTLEYEGEFGFTAVMSVNVDKKNAGKYANLFYFNPKTETMEFICSAPVKEDGTTDLTFTHASDYVIVVSDATMSAADNTSLEDVQGAESGDTSDEPATGEVTTDKKAWTPIWIIVIGAFVIIIGGIVLFAVKKKND